MPSAKVGQKHVGIWNRKKRIVLVLASLSFLALSLDIVKCVFWQKGNVVEEYVYKGSLSLAIKIR